MNTPTFYINQRFLVNTTLHTVEDGSTGEAVRLEPRVMQLLQLLAGSSGQLVTRELLIQQIWRDYGGAEDGLNQAVSILRRTLKDSHRTLIETVPKRGYVLRAEVASLPGEVIKKPEAPRSRRHLRLYYGVAALVLLLGVALWWWYPAAPPSTDVQFVQMEGVKESRLNTVTTIAPDSTHFKLSATGDQRPQLFINGRPASEGEMEQHADLVKKMLTTLWARQAERH